MADNFAQIAKIKKEGSGWTALVGYYAATAKDGTPAHFVQCDRFFAASKALTEKAVRAEYPKIECVEENEL